MSTAIAAARASTKGKRMLQDALDGYGADTYTLSEWNALKKEAEATGSWSWKPRVASTTAAVRNRCEDGWDVDGKRDEDDDDGGDEHASPNRIRARLDIGAAMNKVLYPTPPAVPQKCEPLQSRDCQWRERIAGTLYRCSNEVPIDRKRTAPEPVMSTAAHATEAVKSEHLVCKWHARECINATHPAESSRAIDIANERGHCLVCYATVSAASPSTVSSTKSSISPERVPSTRVPGVIAVDIKQELRRDTLLGDHRRGRLSVHVISPPAGVPSSPTHIRVPRKSQLNQTATTPGQCTWAKEHRESAYMWRCGNPVIAAPRMPAGVFLPVCGFHAPKCVHEYGQPSSGSNGSATAVSNCPPMERRNAFGMCRNHLAAKLSALSFQERAQCVLVENEFDVPGITECRKPVTRAAPPRRHPLAPKEPPPSLLGSAALPAVSRPQTTITIPAPLSTASANNLVRVKAARSSSSPDWKQRTRRWLHHQWRRLRASATEFVSTTLTTVQQQLPPLPMPDAENPLAVAIIDLQWRLQMLRRGPVVARRIQSIFRGNRARRRVRALRYEYAALVRARACRVLQRIARGYLGRLAFQRQHRALWQAIPPIQRVMRGALARRYCHRLRATLRLQRNYRAYRQRCIAWALREEMAYLTTLQRQADANYDAMQLQLAAFRRVRARRVLRAHINRWRQKRAAEARLAASSLLRLVAAIRLQRAWRRHARYRFLKMRYDGAVTIQRRMRGWLTRHMWHGDPGVVFRSGAGFVSRNTGLAYGRHVVLAQQSKSYAVPSWRIRRESAASVVQRVFRGHRGRVDANMVWVLMLKRWEWLDLTPATSEEVAVSAVVRSGSGSTCDSLTLGHERYGFLLPAHRYDRDAKRHMMHIMKTIKPDRGYAYKYQGILELIEDRDGKRAWSLAREEKWMRQHHKQQRSSPSSGPSLLNDGSQSPNPHPTLIPSQGDRHTRETEREHVDAVAASVAMGHVLFPCGSLVEVATPTSKKPGSKPTQYHRATIRASHQDPTRVSNAVTFDVEYLQWFPSPLGVRVYREERVPMSRLRHVPTGTSSFSPAVESTQSKAHPHRQKKSVGVLIQAAINTLKNEIQHSQRQRFSEKTLASDTTPQQQRLQGSQRTKAGNVVAGSPTTVDELVDRLRIDHGEEDLLRDHRDFVNFVFQNALLLRESWLHVVARLRDGTQLQSSTKASVDAKPPSRSVPLSPSLLSFYQEFGFADVPIDTTHVAPKPMPDRAQEVEKRLVALGFQYIPTAATSVLGSIASSDYYRHHENDSSIAIRPTTNQDSAAKGQHRRRASSLSPLDNPSQDVHRLLYELKTLPRELHREHILEISTRHARCFVCGFPACGQCFSSCDATRLHQQREHKNQPRLAVSTPLVDQHMHAFWPSQTPWTRGHQANATTGNAISETDPGFPHIVGYYRCRHAGCDTISFRTRRELWDHQRQQHDDHRHDQDCEDEDNADGRNDMDCGMDAGDDSITSVGTGKPSLLFRGIWLGAATICLSAQDPRLGLRVPSLWCGDEVVRCDRHPKPNDRPKQCRRCFRATRRLELPGRIYDSVALPISRWIEQHGHAATKEKRHVNEGETFPLTDEENHQGYVIFSTVEQSMCAAVRQRDVIRVERHGTRKKRVFGNNRNAYDEDDVPPNSDALMYLRPLSLCRDKNHVNWCLGLAYSPPPGSDGYELKLDDSHLVAVVLPDIRAAAVVHHCSSKQFYHEYHNPGDVVETRRIQSTDNANLSSLTLHRYCGTGIEVLESAK